MLRPLRRQPGRPGHCDITLWPHGDLVSKARPVGLCAESQMVPPLEPLELPTQPPAPGEALCFFNSCKFTGSGPRKKGGLLLPLPSSRFFSNALRYTVSKVSFLFYGPEPGPRLAFRRPLSSVSIILDVWANYVFWEKREPKKVITTALDCTLKAVSKPDLKSS